MESHIPERVGEKKMYEAHPGESYAECKENIRRVLEGVEI